MNERLRENYFVFIRLALMVVLCLYGLVDEARTTGVSVRVLLLVSFYIGFMSLKELKIGKTRGLCMALAVLIYLVIFYFYRESFYLLGILTAFEILTMFSEADIKCYLVPNIVVIFDLLNWKCILLAVAVYIGIRLFHKHPVLYIALSALAGVIFSL